MNVGKMTSFCQTKTLINVLSAFIILAVFCNLSHAAEQNNPYYFRLDGGMSTSRDAGFKNKSCDPLSTPLCYLGPNGLNDIGKSGLVSGGLGFKTSTFFRFDISLDYKTGFKLNETYNGGPNYWGSNTNVVSKISSTSGFATGYVDIASLFNTSFGFFEPYVGLGLGVAHNAMKSGNLKDNSDPANILGAKFSGASNTSFAYRLLIGAGFRLTPTLALDIGYRFSDYGKLSVSNQQSQWSINNSPVPSAFSGFKGNLKADELTAGLRYSF